MSLCPSNTTSPKGPGRVVLAIRQLDSCRERILGCDVTGSVNQASISLATVRGLSDRPAAGRPGTPGDGKRRFLCPAEGDGCLLGPVLKGTGRSHFSQFGKARQVLVNRNLADIKSC